MSYFVSGNAASRTGMHRLIAPIAIAGILASGCGGSATTNPGTAGTSGTPSLGPAVTGTPKAVSSARSTSGAGKASPTPARPASLAPGDRTAPPTLPRGHVNVIVHEGDCFDLDAWAITPVAPGATAKMPSGCDLHLNDSLFLEPVNGAVIAAKGRKTKPTLFDCQAADLGATLVAPDLDSYLCLRTNARTYGFVVEREDRPTAPAGRIVIDFWLYK